jgi:hypothetical protein
VTEDQKIKMDHICVLMDNTGYDKMIEQLGPLLKDPETGDAIKKVIRGILE